MGFIVIVVWQWYCIKRWLVTIWACVHWFLYRHLHNAVRLSACLDSRVGCSVELWKRCHHNCHWSIGRRKSLARAMDKYQFGCDLLVNCRGVGTPWGRSWGDTVTVTYLESEVWDRDRVEMRWVTYKLTVREEGLEMSLQVEIWKVDGLSKFLGAVV
jgi:hypothetical protein